MRGCGRYPSPLFALCRLTCVWAEPPTFSLFEKSMAPSRSLLLRSGAFAFRTRCTAPYAPTYHYLAPAPPTQRAAHAARATHTLHAHHPTPHLLPSPPPTRSHHTTRPPPLPPLPAGRWCVGNMSVDHYLLAGPWENMELMALTTFQTFEPAFEKHIVNMTLPTYSCGIRFRTQNAHLTSIWRTHA